MKKSDKRIYIDVAGLLKQGYTEEQIAHAAWVHFQHEVRGCTCHYEPVYGGARVPDSDCPVQVHVDDGRA
jgi:hypothetical protein